LNEQELEQTTAQVVEASRDSDDATFFGALYDAGLAWIDWPVGFGGLGVAPALQAVVDNVLERAGRRPDWLRNPIGVGMAGPALAVHGTVEQRQRYLRPIFTAEEFWCQLFSEPGAGSDVATLSTRAVRDGDEWVVDGQKVWTSGAHLSQFGLLLARTDPDVPKHAGITAFVLDMASPGLDVRPLKQMNGEAHFNEVYLTGVRIPDSSRVGPEGDGWRVAVTTLMNERVSIGGLVEPQGTGDIEFVLDAWAAAGRPARYLDQVMRLWTEAEVLRLGKLRARGLRERGTPGPQESVLKLAGALLSQRIMSTAVDLTGPNGTLISGYRGELVHGDVGRTFLQAQAQTIAGGTSEIMRNILGERVLGLPPEARSDKTVAWKDIPSRN
jgi:alkylation response protein AidB-like acyl-CoA dehydrogenase